MRSLADIRSAFAAGGSAHEMVFAEMREVLSSEPIEAGHEGVVELSFKAPNLLPSRYSPYAWLGRISNLGGYDVVDANAGLPAFEVRLSTEHDLRGGLVSLVYKAKKRTIKQSAILKVD